MTTTPEDEMTELVDATFPRVDLVGKGANGIKRFLIAKQDADGILDPGYVRDLISKSEPGSGSQDTVTMTGSPAAMARMIHEAAQRGTSRVTVPDVPDLIAKAQAAYPDDPVDVAVSKAAYDEIVKAKYSAEDKRQMAANGQAMKDESYPIKDDEDLSNAIRAVGRGGSSHNAIRRHIMARAKSLGKTSEIPDTWAADGSLKQPVSKDALDVIDPELDEGTDGMDPTVPFVGPDDDDAPGDATDPGSPAWEAIDAATAQKWLAIASRLKNALCLLADREMLEAATGDPDDMDKAFDLEDAACAVDYAIEQLAVFAASEQAEAELGTEMDAIGKAMIDAEQPVTVVEGLTAVAKAGRVLSAVNEQRIRDAAKSLEQVLATLPAPVEKESGQPAADKKEGSMPQPETSADVAAESGQAPDMGVAKAEVAKSKKSKVAKSARRVGRLPVVVFDSRGDALGHVKPGDIRSKVAKADGDDGDKPSLCAVFDQDGELIGVVDPSQIQPVSGAGKPAAPADDTDADGGGATPEPPADGMAPAPAAAVGTPADAGVAKADADDSDDDSGDVAKSDAGTNDENPEIRALKSAVEQVTEQVAAQSASHKEVVAKMAADNEGLVEEVRTLKARLETVEQTPAAPRVMARGQVPPPSQMRGQDQGAVPVDVAKARELKDTLYHGTAREQNAAFGEMQSAAVDALAALHGRGPGANIR